MPEGPAVLSDPVNGSKRCFFVEWSTIDEEARELLLEQLGGDAQEQVLGGTLTPFAVLGDTEESGEELTLVNILDTQHDGVLLHDAARKVSIDDEGSLQSLDRTVEQVVRSAGV